MEIKGTTSKGLIDAIRILITKIEKTIKIINIIEGYKQCQIFFTHLILFLRIFG
jgi:hypothetical protein